MALERIYQNENKTIDDIKLSTINKLSRKCNEFIINGFDFEINGELKHFSMDIYDQVKLLGLYGIVNKGATTVSWHSSGEECIDIEASTFLQFFSIGSILIAYMTTKFNTGLRPYIQNTELTKEELNSMTIHFDLPSEYEDVVLDKAAKSVASTVEEILPIIQMYGW